MPARAAATASHRPVSVPCTRIWITRAWQPAQQANTIEHEVLEPMGENSGFGKGGLGCWHSPNSVGGS